MKTLILFIAISLFSVSAAYSQISGDKSINPLISENEIYKHIEYLASNKLGGRLNGTTGDILAQQYLSAELEKYGCTPKGDTDYLQRFNLKDKAYAGNYMYPINISLNNTKFNINPEDVQLMQVSANGIAKGHLVFAGFGNISDLLDTNGDEVNIKGKILIILDNVPNDDYLEDISLRYCQYLSKKLLALKSRMPAGIIIVRADRQDERLVTLNSERFYFNSELPVVNIRRNTVWKMMEFYGYDLEKIQWDLELKNTSNCFEIKDSYAEFEDNVRRRYKQTSNVIGFIEGKDSVLKNEVVVIGAHFDHVGREGRNSGLCLGADDNASGTAAILEIAQKLSSEKDLLNRSVLITFFGAEEGGLNGSDFFTRSEGFDKYKIVAMLNFDMIGRLRNDSLILYHHSKFPVSISKIKEFNEQYYFNLFYPDAFEGRSDQRSFLAKEIPVLAFFNGIHEDYHTPGDLTRKINRYGAYRIANFGYDIIYYLCTTEFKQQ